MSSWPTCPKPEVCKLVDYSLPLIPYREFNTVRGTSGAVGGVVDIGTITISDDIPAVGDTTILPIEFVGPNGCNVPAVIEATRLTAGGDLTLISSSSLIRVFGPGDYLITIRLLKDCFGNPALANLMLLPSQMNANAEVFIIETDMSQPTRYIRGSGNPTAVNLPLTGRLVWENNNNTGHSAFGYDDFSEVTSRINGGNNVSSVTGIGIIDGPQTFEYGLCDMVELSKRIAAGRENNTGDTDTAATLPPSQGKIAVDFFSDGNQGPFSWQAVISGAPYFEIPNLQGASIISTVDPDGPNPAGTGGNIEFFCEAA